MSTALARVTSNLWLLAQPQPHGLLSAYMRTPSLAQGSALPKSGDLGKPGLELRDLTTNPTVSFPAVGHTAQS